MAARDGSCVMGRIDQAMSRANRDAGLGTGAEAPVPAPSPWQIEQRESAAASRATAVSSGHESVPDLEGGTAPAEDLRQVRWGGFDPDALERLVASKTASPQLVEQFRILAASLHRSQAEHRLSSLLVTSASPGDGKSHVAANLAWTIADSYKRRVLLVDADLRRPTLHHIFRISNARGLCDALDGMREDHVPAVKITDTLALLPAGRNQANPLSALSSDRMKQFVADAASRFDWVLVDSPPVGMLADAHLVSETVDAAVLVVWAGVTRFPELQAAADKLGHERILGLVLNAAEPSEIRGKGYYSYYYGGGRSKD
jgi:capsular exopolysaccharide synthesis family protein